MKQLILSYVRLFGGLFLYGLGIVININAGLGMAPWEVFHQGLGHVIGITMGQASIAMGVLIVVFNFAFREKVGMGTIFNMIFIGLILDFLMLNHLVPTFENIIIRFLSLFVGMFTIAFATYLYISAKLGAGPRDGLMIVLHKKTGKSVRFCRNAIEVTVTVLGFFMGGTVGIATVIISVGIGYVTQFVLKILKLDVKEVQHRYVDDSIRRLLKRPGSEKSE